MRKRQKRDWKALISEQENSGLSIDEFCETKGIHYTSFYKNRKKFQEKGFVEVKPVVPKTTKLKTEPLILRYHEFTIEIPKGFDASSLKEVISTLGNC